MHIYKALVGDIFELLVPLRIYDRYDSLKIEHPIGTKFVIEKVLGTAYTSYAGKGVRVRYRLNFWGSKAFVDFDFLTNARVLKLDDE